MVYYPGIFSTILNPDQKNAVLEKNKYTYIIMILCNMLFWGYILFFFNKSTEKSFSLEAAYEECWKEEYRDRITHRKFNSKYPLQNVAAGEKVVNVMCRKIIGEKIGIYPFSWNKPTRVYGYYQIFTPAGTEGRMENYNALLEERSFASILVKD